MKKQITLWCALFLLTSLSIQATENKELKDGVISGVIIDAALNEPMPYVNVIVKSLEGDVVTGGITQENGTFKIDKIPEGKFTVTAQYIGYKSVTKEVTIAKGNYKIDLGRIMLEESASALDEVTVTAEVSTIQQKVDRKVITIGKDLAASGTASDIMIAIPSVNVDQQTGNISLRGNQNVQVMVDGKLSNIPAAQLLRQLPSNSIKQIELITNPSAKYNPEGLSGLINIVLKKNVNIGFNGNLNVGLRYQREPKFNSSIDMNYRNGKFNLYGNYGNNLSKNQTDVNIAQIVNNSLQTIDILDDRDSHLFKVGVDLYLNEKNTLSFFTNQNIFEGDNLILTNLDFITNPSNDQDQEINSINENHSSQYNFDYKLDFAKEGHNIELEVDYNTFNNDIETNNLFSGPNARPNFLEFTDTERDRTTINLDYVNPLSENTKLELGLQARLFDTRLLYNSDARIRNSMGEFIPSATDYDYSRDIFSAYVTYGKQLEKWSYQLGLRAESVNVDALAIDTDLDANVTTLFPFENDYVQLYPSAFFTYNPSEKNSYQLSYSRRVDRPGVGQVNPIPEFNTPLVSQFGNQNLQPQFTNSIEVNYTRKLKKGSLTAGTFFRVIEDEINQAVRVDDSDLDSGRIILTFDNFDNTTAYGIELSSNYRPVKWWSLNASFDLYSQTQRSFSEVLDASIINPTMDDIRLEEVEVDNVIWNFRVFNNFRVNKKLTFTAFGLYRGKDRGLQFETDPIYFLNLGMRYNFIPNGTFSLNFNDVLGTQEISILGERPFLQTADVSPEFRTVSASILYRFGGGKYRAKSRKQRDKDEKDGGSIF
ncbi:TonB-dependent receptor [Flavobacteriaceae bacterium AU392]|nr:TonB-dependent receptor [Flavobacteriaceae bacterium]RKM81111.1 TonB-dependent receptor [Flavobacteriaceae bacterium AU392]